MFSYITTEQTRSMVSKENILSQQDSKQLLFLDRIFIDIITKGLCDTMQLKIPFSTTHLFQRH